MAHRLDDGFLGHRIEDHAVDALVFENALALQDFVYVPGNGLAFAIRVGRQDHPFGVLDRGGDLGKTFGRLAVDLPQHGEIVIGIDRSVLGGEIANMAERGVDVIVLAQIPVDCLGLGRRFDDHNLHANLSSDAGSAGP
jgi:hypothetical protein